MRKFAFLFCISGLFLGSFCVSGQSKPRARDLGVPFDGNPGPLNAVVDVKGVEVGNTTLISGEGPLKLGVGPVANCDPQSYVGHKQRTIRLILR